MKNHSIQFLFFVNYHHPSITIVNLISSTFWAYLAFIWKSILKSKTDYSLVSLNDDIKDLLSFKIVIFDFYSEARVQFKTR